MGGNQSYAPSPPPVVVQKVEKKGSIIRLRRHSESSTNESVASSGRTLRPILQPIPPEDVEYSYVLTRERDRASAKQKQVRLGEYSQPVDAQTDQGDAYCEPYQARKLLEKIQADQERRRSPKTRGPPSIPPPPPPSSSPLDNVYDVARSLPPEPLYDSPPSAENDEDSKHHVPEIRRPSGASPQSLELEPALSLPSGGANKSVIENPSLKSRSSTESPRHRLVKAVSVDGHPDISKAGPSSTSPPRPGPEPAIYNDPWDNRQQQEQLHQKLMRHQGAMMAGKGGSMDHTPQARMPTQPPNYEEAWDSPERQRQLQQILTRQLSSPAGSTPSDGSPSPGAGANRAMPRSQSSSSSNTYEEAWDSAERQRQLEEKVMAAHHRSGGGAGVVGRGPSPGLGRGPSPGAGPWSSSPTGSGGTGARGPSPGAGSLGGAVRGPSPTGGSIGRGSPPAVGVGGHLKGPSPNGSWGSMGSPGPSMQSAPQQNDLYSEPWDSAEKQRELAARLQASHLNSGWQGGGSQTSSPQLSVGSGRSRVSEKEEWDMPGSRSRPGPDFRLGRNLANTHAGSSGSLKSQMSCTIGQPIDPMLPLEHQNWYHGNISRVHAETMLRVSKEGSFLVRESETERGQYSLSIKNPRQNIHLRIAPCHGGSFILGENSRAFPTIPEMIDYYTRHPVPLKGAEHITLLHPVECKWSSQ